MSITVREVWELKEFHSFQLVAGESGLDKRIDSIGILDYEYAMKSGEDSKKWFFRKHDFVISSLLFAKDNPGILMSAIIDLCNDQVSTLAVKNVCFQELPKNVLEYADEHGLPIFVFGRDDAYFEDIIVCLKGKIAERNDLELQEHRISMFMSGELDIKGQRELNREILSNRVDPYRILYCFIKAENGKKIRDYRKYYPTRERGDGKQSLFYYKGGCFVVVYTHIADAGRTDKDYARYREFLMEQLKMPPEDYWIGMGEIHENQEELFMAMKESLCAQQYARLFEISRVSYQEMGIYQILLPSYREEWFQRYSRKIIQQLLEFDRRHDGDLYKTTEQYVKNYGNILEVAEKMYLHKNTVRYRINKVREILDMEEEPGFDIQISMALMIDELNQWFCEEF